MRISNTVTKTLAALLLCAASVGCATDDVKQPAAAEISAVSENIVTQKQSKLSGDDKITITAHVDPKTGEEYQELNATFTVEKFNRDPSEHRYYVGINNVAIVFGKTYGKKTANLGHIQYPDGLLQRNEQDINWNNLIGKKATLYCKITEPFVSNDKFCWKTYGLWGCSRNGDTKFTFNYYCHLDGKSEYTLKFD